eukprot:COSAG03_NODE_1168_length_4664_cov_6.133949_4_plen_109_part_00
MQVRAKIYRISSGEEEWLDYDKILPILKVSPPARLSTTLHTTEQRLGVALRADNDPRCHSQFSECRTQDVGYNGWMSIVYEGQDDLEETEAMRKATKYLRSALQRHKL